MLISDKQKKILTLLADGEFHSGTELAEIIGVSRSAICKQVKGLSDLGLQHSAVSGKGYRLNKALDLLTPSKINASLGEECKALVSTLEIHDSLNSTNSYLVEHSRNNAASGFVCFAEHQTAGKGRRGRQWVSPYGSNIYMSLLWRFQQGGIIGTAGLSLAIGVAVIRALKEHEINEVGLKWPNDIYSQGKKLGGILIEVSGEADGPCAAVIGIGLNLFLPEIQAQSITQAWTDLTNISGENLLPRNRLAGTLLKHILVIVNGFETVGIKAYLDEWRRYDCLKGNLATLFIGQQQIEGIVDGIDDNGLLLIKKPDGTIQAFASGEVSFSAPIV
ncbi:bifunctional biotin--[acetyl-CoA-carboxylase] ligase/biotin operon repressor BirA [Methylobacter sp. S3L5C]|uniref:bifunctional biotin--[acetyl-CoA-carboxylase] ligase/biotin operon repressor BirA n=1 Tax=Methylobacter sp. S3L5C TaxID=2839024 RepID=UPI001FADB138|nr:bifunctional biotin--[acetyl-CoA-carboxylase] ligase/biotin operon repressor BirA [Methylobacter sp. S3L5C]UOA08720.1 bifunctional biotin--[acetyl-CoA-carboxylase] ligase/biotin operon repressor BirA [Methylobacter sp. S3L5C]